MGASKAADDGPAMTRRCRKNSDCGGAKINRSRAKSGLGDDQWRRLCSHHLAITYQECVRGVGSHRYARRKGDGGAEQPATGEADGARFHRVEPFGLLQLDQRRAEFVAQGRIHVGRFESEPVDADFHDPAHVGIDDLTERTRRRKAVETGNRLENG